MSARNDIVLYTIKYLDVKKRKTVRESLILFLICLIIYTGKEMPLDRGSVISGMPAILLVILVQVKVLKT